jgi:hypothetical protein
MPALAVRWQELSVARQDVSGNLPAEYEIDHIDGSNSILTNLQALCGICHNAKSARERQRRHGHPPAKRQRVTPAAPVPCARPRQLSPPRPPQSPPPPSVLPPLPPPQAGRSLREHIAGKKKEQAIKLLNESLVRLADGSVATIVGADHDDPQARI